MNVYVLDAARMTRANAILARLGSSRFPFHRLRRRSETCSDLLANFTRPSVLSDIESSMPARFGVIQSDFRQPPGIEVTSSRKEKH